MGLIISCFIPVMVSCGKDPNQAGCPRSLPSTAAMGVSKLVMIGRDPVIPARHAAGQVLVKLENGERLNGQAYAVASWYVRQLPLASPLQHVNMLILQQERGDWCWRVAPRRMGYRIRGSANVDGHWHVLSRLTSA